MNANDFIRFYVCNLMIIWSIFSREATEEQFQFSISEEIKNCAAQFDTVSTRGNNDNTHNDI